MAWSPEDSLVIGISSRALFRLDEEDRIYNDQGTLAFIEYERSHEADLPEPGVAFPLVEALLKLNDKLPTSGQPPIEIVIISKNHPDCGIRIRRALKHYKLNIRRAVFTGGQPTLPYLNAFKVDLFLSKEEAAIKEAIAFGISAGLIHGGPEKPELKPRKDAPRADKLEAACHKAASMILVPGKALKAELREHPPADTGAIVGLSGRFEVSIEVMVRRLNEIGTFENGWAPILTRRNGDVLAIEYAAYPPWLKSHLAMPKRGMPFKTWLRGVEHPDGTFTKETHRGMLGASPVSLSGSSVMFELRIRSSSRLGPFVPFAGSKYRVPAKD